MNRRALLLAAATGVSVLAGCQRQRTCPPQLHVDEIDQSESTEYAERTIPYQQLPGQQQREFSRALETGGVELDETYEAWLATDVVTYSGDYYVTPVMDC